MGVHRTYRPARSLRIWQRLYFIPLPHQQGALRETWEEARARVEILAPYSLFNLPHVNQLYVIFRAVLPEPVFEPGPESEDVRLFAEQDIPWADLAFGTVRQTLTFFFEDRARGLFPMRSGTIVPQENGFRFEAGPDDQLRVAESPRPVGN